MTVLEIITSVIGASGFSLSAVLYYKQKRNKGEQENYGLVIENLRHGMEALTSSMETLQKEYAELLSTAIVDKKKLVDLEHKLRFLEDELLMFRCERRICDMRIPPRAADKWKEQAYKDAGLTEHMEEADNGQ